MKAIVTTRSGGPEVLELQEFPAPATKAGEVVVNVDSIGLNFADVVSALGKYPGGPKPPYVGGREFAGTVAETGERVMGYAEQGAFAAQIAAQRHRLWPLPQGWSMAQGAAFPVNYFTAYLVYWKAGLIPGAPGEQLPEGRRPRVLIHAVAGGVGTAATAIGKLLDLEMFGTSSSDAKLQGAFELGLTHGLNYSRQDYEQAILDYTHGEGVDTVFEMIGGENTAKSVRCLAFLGRCVLYGTASGKQPVLDARALYAKCASVHGFWLSPTASRPEVMGPAWAKLNDWITQGHLKPVIGHLMPLEELAEAFRLMLGRKNFGKIVLTVNS